MIMVVASCRVGRRSVNGSSRDARYHTSFSAGGPSPNVSNRVAVAVLVVVLLLLLL